MENSPLQRNPNSPLSEQLNAIGRIPRAIPVSLPVDTASRILPWPLFRRHPQHE